MRNPQPQASDGRNRCGSPYDPDQARGAPVRGLGAASEGGHTEPDRAQRTAGITDQVVGRHAAHGNTDQRRPSSRCTARFSPWHFQRRRAGRVRRGRKRMVADGAPPIRSRVITMRMTSSAPGLTLYAHGRCQGGRSSGEGHFPVGGDTVVERSRGMEAAAASSLALASQCRARRRVRFPLWVAARPVPGSVSVRAARAGTLRGMSSGRGPTTAGRPESLRA